MVWREQDRRSARAVHFFVSYSPLDERWATWLAWELESAGYRTMLQAWDFVPGTNFIDFMDRGLRECVAVIAVLSRNYMRSHYGRLEWQAALRSAPQHPSSRLITVRIEDFELEGLLAAITFLDLVGVEDPQVARARLLGRIQDAIDGRAKPATGPNYPSRDAAVTTPPVPAVPARLARHPRLDTVEPVAYPPAMRLARSRPTPVTLLRVPGPRFGADPDDRVPDLLDRIKEDLGRSLGNADDAPHGLLISGNLTESGGIRQFDEALKFVVSLRAMLKIDPAHVAVVPGPHDVTRAAARAYFAECEADEVEPEPPFWPKWRHFSRFFAELYEHDEDTVFTAGQPWSLFEMPQLGIVVGGINTTIAESHRDEDHYGLAGETQLRWFAQHLGSFDPLTWVRIALMHHNVDDPVVRDGEPLRSMVDHHFDTAVAKPTTEHMSLLTVTIDTDTNRPVIRSRSL